jgi:hypothetical protein
MICLRPLAVADFQNCRSVVAATKLCQIQRASSDVYVLLLYNVIGVCPFLKTSTDSFVTSSRRHWNIFP